MRCAVIVAGIFIVTGLVPARHKTLAAEKSPSPQTDKLKTRTITLAIAGMT